MSVAERAGLDSLEYSSQLRRALLQEVGLYELE
jgi:hypothetical protein